MFHRATGAFVLEIQLQGYVQTDATLLANNSQYCWMLHLASVFTLCCMMLRVVGSCCAKFETGKTFSPAQTDVTLFGVHVASVCT